MVGTRIEVMTKGSIRDTSGLVSQRPIKVYNINDDFSLDELNSLKKLLSDPITETVTVNQPVIEMPLDGTVIEVSPKPGVNDPDGNRVRQSISAAIKRKIGEVSTAQQYLWRGSLDDDEYRQLQRGLGTTTVREFQRVDASSWDNTTGVGFHFPLVDLPPVKPFEYINTDVDDTELLGISKTRYLSLNLEEMSAIRTQFTDLGSGLDAIFFDHRASVGLDSTPTDAELECLAQTWSEHCKHKKFTGRWVYTTDDPNDESGLSNKNPQLPTIINNMFKSIIVETTTKIAKSIDWLVSVFTDNSGVIKLNDRWNIAHKVETHNHPSSLDPYGGSNTGLGGVIRDTQATGKGMITISGQYGFRLPPPWSFTDIVPNINSPTQTLRGVVAGVEDYGNKMGIPTGCGQLFFDDGWFKPGMYAGAVSVAPAEVNGRKTHKKKVRQGYIALSLGGRVGKDGIHGATASSTDLAAGAEKDVNVNQSVQIGDPIVQKGVFDVQEILMLQDLVEATQDCGAGGWSSALGELAEMSNGVRIDLTNAPEKYKGLTGWEKLISEAQERQIIVIKPENIDHVLQICNQYNVEATKMAEFNNSGYMQVLDQDKTIAFLPMSFLHHDGLPQMTIKAHWSPPKLTEPVIHSEEELTSSFLNLLSQPNIQIYDWVSTRYDHEVQGRSLLKPIVGLGRGKSDAIAYHAILGEKEVVIETWGSNPWQGVIDAYNMGRNNVVDAVGRVIAAGGNLEKIAFNGNTTCAKPEKDPAIAAQVIRMIKGAADAELALGTPTISGKDSTSMERSYISTQTGEEISVKAKSELLMSALGVIPGSSTITSPDFKLAGDLIYVVGDTRNELGGSEFYLMHKETGKNVPKSNLDEIKSRYKALSSAVQQQLVHSAQYIAKGGLAVAIANSAIGGDLGLNIDVGSIDGDIGAADKILYSETTGRFVVTIHPSNKKAFEESMADVYTKQIGEVRPDKEVAIKYNGKDVVKTDVDTIREKNKGAIRF